MEKSQNKNLNALSQIFSSIPAFARLQLQAQEIFGPNGMCA